MFKSIFLAILVAAVGYSSPALGHDPAAPTVGAGAEQKPKPKPKKAPKKKAVAPEKKPEAAAPIQVAPTPPKVEAPAPSPAPVPQPQPPTLAAEKSFLHLAAGMFGTFFAPDRSFAWAWGPMLQLQHVNGVRELAVSLGYAGGGDGFGWSPGRTRAWLVELDYTRWRWDMIGWTLGAHIQWIGAKPSWETGTYIGFVPGLSLRWHPWDKRLRLDLKPFLGVNSYQDDGENHIAFGATSALTFTWK